MSAELTYVPVQINGETLYRRVIVAPPVVPHYVVDIHPDTGETTFTPASPMVSASPVVTTPAIPVVHTVEIPQYKTVNGCKILLKKKA